MKNRGMLLENIINKTINSYEKNNRALFHKKNVDIKFKSKEKDSVYLKDSFISKKSTVDYYGIYNGLFVAFEAKSTNENFFSINNFKKHQQLYLEKISSLGGKSFYIFCFKNKNEFYMMNALKINLKENKKSINYDYIKNNSFSLELIYPGYIDFLEYIDFI